MFSGFKSFVLFIFVLIDVISYDASPVLQIALSIIVYSFLLISLVRSLETSVMYFISFNVLCIGLGNSQSDILFNYWGFRVGLISLNMVFILMYFFVIALKFRVFSKGILEDKLHKFFFYYFIYCSIIGLFKLAISDLYLDNYVEDVMTFLPALLFIVIMKVINIDEFKRILTGILIATSLQMLLSYIFNKKFYYGHDAFIVNNSIYLIFPFALIILKKYFNPTVFFLMLISFTYFALTQNYFISGKTIVLVLVILFWITFKSWKTLLFFIIPLFVIFINLEFILEGAEIYFSELPSVAFKFGQIKDAILYITDPFLFAELPTSFSNLVAELLTVIRYSYEHPFSFIIGNGFGATVPDYWGFLHPFVGDGGGYKVIDMQRNAYFKMHMPIYDIILKGGIIFIILYGIILKDAFFKNKKYGIIHFVMMFTIFALSKETLLLTLIIYYALSSLQKEENYTIIDQDLFVKEIQV